MIWYTIEETRQKAKIIEMENYSKMTNECDVCNEVQNVERLQHDCVYVKTPWETVSCTRQKLPNEEQKLGLSRHYPTPPHHSNRRSTENE